MSVCCKKLFFVFVLYMSVLDLFLFMMLLCISLMNHRLVCTSVHDIFA